MFSVYALNNVASKYKIGLKGDVAKSTIRVGEFNTPLSIIDKRSRARGVPQQTLANVGITVQPDKPLEHFRGDPGPESLERRTRIYRECSSGSPSLCRGRLGPRGSSLPAPWLPRVAALGSACGAGLGGWGILLKGSEKRALGRGRARKRRCGRRDRTGPGGRKPGSPDQLGHRSEAAGAAGGDCSGRPARGRPRGAAGRRRGTHGESLGGPTGRAERPAGQPPSLGEGRQGPESFYQQSRAIRGCKEGDNRVL